MSPTLTSASAYAAFNPSSAVALISPRRSIIVTPALFRTRASNCCACIVISFPQKNELDGMTPLIDGHVHVVDHVLDQEEPPATRALQSLQLGLETRLDRGGVNRCVALVGDRH